MWEFRTDGLYVSSPLAEDPTDTSLYLRLCERVEVTKTMVNLLTGEETVEIVIYKKYGEKRLMLEKRFLTIGQVLKPLLAQGLTIISSADNAAAVLEVLFDTADTASVEYYHTEIGFRLIGGQLCFLGSQAYGPLTQEQQCSRYAGATFIPTGAFKKWRQMLLNVVVPNKCLSLAFALAATGPVAYLLREQGLLTDVPIFAMINESSKGKSSCLRLLCSATSTQELIHSFNATTAAFFGLLEKQNGLTFLADEATYLQEASFDINELVYAMNSGVEKRRCNGDGRVKPAVTFGGSIVLTSEQSILERCIGLGGQRARVFELSFPWTKSAEEAETINRVCSQHHGWALDPLMKLLMQPCMQATLRKRYQHWYAKFVAAAGSEITGIDRRLLQKAAVVLVSAWAMEKAVKVDLHKSLLEELLLSAFYENADFVQQRSAADELMDMILSFVAQHRSKFPADTESERKALFFSQDIYGARGVWGNKKCLWILKDVFRKIIAGQTRFSMRKACEHLEDAGYLVRFYGDRYFRSKQMGPDKPQAYCVLPPEECSLVEELTNLPSGKQSVKELAKTIYQDPHGLNDYQELDLKNRTKSVKPTMAIGFVRVDAQSLRLVINSSLAKRLALHANERLHIAAIPAKGLLMLSSIKMTNDDLVVTTSRINDQYVADGPTVLALGDAFHLNIDNYERLVLWDIEVEKGVAIINVLNSEAKQRGPLGTSSLYTINDISKRCAPMKGTQLSTLLTEEGEED